jgi:hypothetical protein
MGNATHVTIATSSGLTWLALVTHFGLGLVGIVTGAIALSVAKGGTTHKQVGLWFAWAMGLTGVVAAGIAVYETKVGSVVGGLLTTYFAVTATTTLRPLTTRTRPRDVALAAFAFAVAFSGYWSGIVTMQTPGMRNDSGAPAPMIFFLATVTLSAAIGDARIIRAGGITGGRRLARHLWRMCFALFIATGSFFLGQMKFLPRPLHILPLLLGVAVSPLVVLLYWMWRVRIRKAFPRLARMTA